jgi:hypothetical protein
MPTKDQTAQAKTALLAQSDGRPLYARTFSATARHIPNPDDRRRTLCGHQVVLCSEYRGEDGELAQPDAWMILELPPCKRCERSAASRPCARSIADGEQSQEDAGHAAEYRFVASVHRPGLADVHLGFRFRHHAESAARSLTQDLVNTCHREGTTITWAPAPDGVQVESPVPTDAHALADLMLAARQSDYRSSEDTFPDLFSRLKAQESYEDANRMWETACSWLDYAAGSVEGE